MTPVLFAAPWWHTLIGILMSVTAVFLMLIVLVQRGRGGGLAGAFGGAGGQSAFGTKAGDLFTRITIVVALCWGILCVVALWALGPTASRFGSPTNQPSISASEDGDDGTDGLSGGGGDGNATDSPDGTPAENDE